MSMKEVKPSLERLKSVLASYGANPSRWPDDERDELLSLLRGNEVAGRLRGEHHALDRALDSAKIRPPSDALRSNILKIAVPAIKTGQGGEVLPFPKPDRDRAGHSFLNWPTAAVLAASLLIGVWIGAGDIGGTLISETLDIASLENYSDAYTYDIGLAEAEELL